MVKVIALKALKAVGIFWLSRKIFRNKSLILAYHGFEIEDEADFRPQLYMRRRTFLKRMDYIERHFNIIDLESLKNKDNPDNSIVLTFDDGWYSTFDQALPILKSRKWPYIVYYPTLDGIDGKPLFHIALDYILRKSIGKSFEVKGKDGRPKKFHIKDCDTEITKINRHVNEIKNERNDYDLLSKIGQQLGFNMDQLSKSKMFQLATPDEISQEDLPSIQLHTHTHNTPLDNTEEFIYEITENQKEIEKFSGITPLHHCYPSGQFNSDSVSILKTLGIKTATTCIPGFVSNKTNDLALPRFLDGENIDQIVFEAELSGILELFRKAKFWQSK